MILAFAPLVGIEIVLAFVGLVSELPALLVVPPFVGPILLWEP